MHFYRKCWFNPFEEQFISPFLSDCPSLMLGIAIHSQAMLERGVCELAHSFFHLMMFYDDFNINWQNDSEWEEFFGCWFTNIPWNNDVAVHWKKLNPFTQGHLMQILIENVTMIMEILNFIVTAVLNWRALLSPCFKLIQNSKEIM